MLGVRLSSELEGRLQDLCEETGRTKSYYAKKAIEAFLDDKEDYLKGIAVLEQKEPRVALKDLEKALGLDSWIFKDSSKTT